LALLPPGYLAVRALERGPGFAWRVVTTEGTAQLMERSLALAAAVGAACYVLGISLEWLTKLTTLLGVRAMPLMDSVPLAVPRYVAAFVWLSAVHGLAGFTGSAISLSLVSYPYVYLPVAAALRGIVPAQEEAARSLGLGPWVTFLRVTLPHLRPA